MKKFPFSFHSKAAILTGLGLACLVSVNCFAVGLTNRLGLRFDMTSHKLYQLSDETISILEQLQAPVSIRIFSSESDFIPLIAEVLEQYELRSHGTVRIEYIDPYVHPTLLDEYIQKGYELTLGSIAVESDTAVQILQPDSMFALNSSGNAVQEIRCEPLISNAILSVAGTEELQVQFITGHNEYVSDGLMELFRQNHYQTDYLSLSMDSVDPDADLLIIASPTADYSSEEIASLDTWMANNGRLAVFLGPASDELPNLEAFLNEWGIATTQIAVAEERQYTDSNPLSIVPIYSAHSINQYFQGNQLYLIMPSTRALKQLFLSQGGIRTQKLLYSSDRSYDYENPSGEKGPFALAIVGEKQKDTGNARIAVIGSRGLYSDSLLSAENYANRKFLTRLFNWCTETSHMTDIAARQIGDSHIAITAGQVLALAFLFVILFPSAAFITGIVVFQRRHRS